MPDIITQAGIKSILETYNALGQRILGFRRRIQAGAFIEPGDYQAHDADEQPIDMKPTEFLNAYGLDIAPVGRRSELYYAPHVAMQETAEASRPAPKWWTAMDPESMYQLSFRGEDCSLDPCIELTRTEFIALKEQLAEMRGYRTATEATNA